MRVFENSASAVGPSDQRQSTFVNGIMGNQPAYRSSKVSTP
jgi:hypothetical protein